MRWAADFDSVALVPQFNNVPSRTETDLSTWLTKDLKLGMPLLAANMDTVISPDLAKVLLDNGGIPIFHRFADTGLKIKWARDFKHNCFVSCGLTEKWNVLEAMHSIGILGFCVDVAHGHSLQVMKRVSELKKLDTQVIAGNVCTPIAYHDLVNAGADAVKVGIGPGAACTTRKVTGFGVPQLQAILDCAEIANKLRVPMIADGGIKGSRELILALAAGASTVMIGSLFAATDESAAPWRCGLAGEYKTYRGQASRSFQEDFYGQVKPGTVPEGKEELLAVSGPAQELIDTLLGGLRSGLTYSGSVDIKELQRKAEWIRH